MMWPEFWGYGRGRNPWGEFRRMEREMDQLFSRLRRPYRQEYPAVNVWTGEEGLIVTAEVPGIDPASIDISVFGETLTLSGSRPKEELKEGETYHRQERGYGRFSRTIQLPFRVEVAKVEAKYERGVLRVHLPRLEEEKPKKIEIKIA